jgi:hypothetical protein
MNDKKRSVSKKPAVKSVIGYIYLNKMTLFRPAVAAIRPSVQLVPELFTRRENGQEVKVTTHFH